MFKSRTSLQSEKTAFIANMEQLFGSDEALGVYFELDDEGSKLTTAQYDEMFARLGDDVPSASSYLPHGGSAICCTDYAKHIFMALPGRVEIYGFANEDNPTSRVAKEEMHPEGHDFAVVDGRFIVDPWPRLVPAEFEQMVFDLSDRDDFMLAFEIYGPGACWTRMLEIESYCMKETHLFKRSEVTTPIQLVSAEKIELPRKESKRMFF